MGVCSNKGSVVINKGADKTHSQPCEQHDPNKTDSNHHQQCSKDSKFQQQFQTQIIHSGIVEQNPEKSIEEEQVNQICPPENRDLTSTIGPIIKPNEKNTIVQNLKALATQIKKIKKQRIESLFPQTKKRPFSSIVGGSSLEKFQDVKMLIDQGKFWESIQNLQELYIQAVDDENLQHCNLSLLLWATALCELEMYEQAQQKIQQCLDGIGKESFRLNINFEQHPEAKEVLEVLKRIADNISPKLGIKFGRMLDPNKGIFSN